MKLLLCLSLACAGLLAAQDQPRAGGAVAAAKNILCLVETCTLSKTDYAMLLDAPEGHAKLHERVRAAVTAGRAKLDGCHLILGQSGARSRVACVDELIDVTHWGDADSKGLQYPSAFDMQLLGDLFELEPALNEEGGRLDFVQCFSRGRFQGLRLTKADSTLPGVPVAECFFQKGQSHCRLAPGVPALLSTLSDAQGDAITLVFATPQVVEVAAPKAPAPPRTGTVRMTARVISLDRTKARALLQKHAADGAACLAELKPLLAGKQAVLEHVSTTCTVSGVHAVHQSGERYTYGSEMPPPSLTEVEAEAPKPTTLKAPGGPEPMALESRDLGFRIDLDPVLAEDGNFVRMTVTVEHVRMTGNLKDRNWNEHYLELPVFSSQTLSTEYTQMPGTTALIGTLNPPGATGVNEHKDEERVWLVFMDVNLQ